MHKNNSIGRLDFSTLIDILPGNNKLLVDISIKSLAQIIDTLDNINSRADTIVLANVDPWFYDNELKDIFSHPTLSGKMVFLQTQQYENVYYGNNKWKISYPAWYMDRPLPPSRSFVPQKRGLTYGFGSLNNRPALHRMLLGTELCNRNLLSSIIYTQNNTHQMGFGELTDYTPGEIDPRFIQDPDFLNNIPGFLDYKKLMPFKWNNQPIRNLHYIHHEAEHSAYCNIVTESATEMIPYGRGIDCPEISEKSHKPFVSKQIPIYLASRGHLAYLRGLGFDTMSELLPEDFDEIYTIQKIKAIADLVQRGRDYIEQFYFDNLSRIQHNYELVHSDSVEKTIIKRITEIL